MSDDLVKNQRADAAIYNSPEMSRLCAQMKRAADRIEALERVLSNMLEDGDKTDREEAARLLGRSASPFCLNGDRPMKTIPEIGRGYIGYFDRFGQWCFCVCVDNYDGPQWRIACEHTQTWFDTFSAPSLLLEVNDFAKNGLGPIRR